MVTTHVLGYPRIGAKRELKFALEAFWRGETDEAALQAAAGAIRRENWTRQKAAGLDFLTAGDFSLYDHVLSQAALLGCLPARFGFDPARLTLSQYFAAARGAKDPHQDQHPLEMTKWFDTNYHYLVPELSADTKFRGGPGWYFDEIREASALGAVKPVLPGPLTFLRLAKAAPGFDRLRLIEPLAAAYARLLERIKALGVEWVQIDEPALCLDLDEPWLAACEQAYRILAGRGPRLILTTYFDSAAEHADRIVRLPVQGVHVDLVRAPEQLDAWRKKLPGDWVLSAGVVDGRNVWRADLSAALARLRPLHDALGERLWIAPSCSLLHVPVSLPPEEKLDLEVRPWLAFAGEKLEEIRVLGVALEKGDAAVRAELNAADAALASRRASRRVTLDGVRGKVEAVTPAMERRSAFAIRDQKQRARGGLPLLPTTTIGSFPQTASVRSARAAFKRGEIGHLKYLEAMRGEIRHAIECQEALGLDVLVHGEAERNDMVEYFGERLWGYCFTQHGWVQSYGSRCVKPPILYGDVMRPEMMTVDTARYAQSLTKKPVKGMLTGPVTMLQWSFVRDDQPRRDTAMQLALAIREEVADLEKAGIRVIQIDEPALREGLPLKERDWPAYFDWATRAFRVAASVAQDETQIHTHMCYAEFNDILPAIAALDADVITIEASRSRMELLDGFGAFRFPAGIGPGVYDIHSPRVPPVEEMLGYLERACSVIAPERLWVNPDCGLKTRGWTETEAALRNMVEAARRARARLKSEVAGDRAWKARAGHRKSEVLG